MQAEVLISTVDMNRQEWLDARKNGIGGSDVSAIAGLNKWKSPVGVYLDKIGASPDEDSAGEAAYWGNVMEDVVAQEFSIRTGLRVRRRNAILKHPKHPFMLANVDRLIVGKREGLECKTASEYLKGSWEDEEIPAAYLLQIQHYMAVTGYDAWHIAVLIGGNKFLYKKVERDEELISYLITIEKDFWENNVLKQIPPMFDGSDASVDLLKALYPESVPDSEVQLPGGAGTFIEALDEISVELKSMELQKKEYENQIKDMMKDNEKAYSGERTITWKSYDTNRFDSKRFKVEEPDLYKKYVNTTTARKLVIK
ncbi:YqaJ viral recombinase family protein [Sporosarcina sp. resist]|uniref:YqaJ viral recombinase family nuclease n=1 Tax=Sporosarcina sp. resist TaxID=2762563 RepID=UPI00164D6E81|nr:YqaJ viral recombinase family protein [Sporosarcina sp. resist]QNK89401.1 YqaJ viral recombinase family protein [Sporosarcina sp. resist]